jgi:hypothetical protein
VIEHFASSIPGVFTEQDFYFLKYCVARAETPSHWVELYPGMGRCSAYLAVEIIHAKKFIKLDCVDTWQSFSGSFSQNNAHYTQFCQNLNKVRGLWNPVQLEPELAAQRYPDETLGWVFINVSGSLGNLGRDIETWKQKVKPGGMLAGYGWNLPPVSQTAMGLLNHVITHGNCWWWTKKQAD